MADALINAAGELGDDDLLEALTAALPERHAVLQALCEWAGSVILFPSSIITDCRYTGTIKSYNLSKGFGFISCPEIQEAFGTDAFLHGNKMSEFNVGDEVNFAAFLNKDQKVRAFDVLPGSPEMNGKTIRGKGGGSWNDTGKGNWAEEPQAQKAGKKKGASKGSGKAFAPPVVVHQGQHLPPAPSPAAKQPRKVVPTPPPGVQPPPPAVLPPRPPEKPDKPASRGRPRGEEFQPMPGVTDKRFSGSIKMYNDKNGYGFITSDTLSKAWGEPVEAFLHRNEIGDNEIGAAVTFSVHIGPNGMPRAQELKATGQAWGAAGGGKRQRTW